MATEKPTVGQKGACEILGKSVNYFKDNIRWSEKFQRNVPNKMPNALHPTYLRHDVERFRNLNEWF